MAVNLDGLTTIIAARSVSGIAGVATLLKDLPSRDKVQILFSSTKLEREVKKWPSDKVVAFVGLEKESILVSAVQKKGCDILLEHDVPLQTTSESERVIEQVLVSKRTDDVRLVYVARHFAASTDTDDKIEGWIKEYKTLMAGHSEILGEGKELKPSIFEYKPCINRHDLPTLLKQALKKSPVAVINNTKIRIKDESKFGVAIGTHLKDLNLFKVLKSAKICASGSANKVAVHFSDMHPAIQAIRKSLPQ